MPKTHSMAEALAEAHHATEVSAYQQAYAVATEITKNVITRYGNHESEKVVKYWSEIADGTAKKILADSNAILKH